MIYKMPKMGFRKRVGRVVRKVTRAGVRYAKKRYVNKKGNLRLGKIAKDVAMVKKLINVEKKRHSSSYNGVTGQVNGAGSGAVLIDITPNIVQGQTASTRNGNSVKLTGMYLQGQFIQQSNAIDGNHVVVEVWHHKAREVPMSLGSTGQELYNASPFSGQIDMVSRRNQDHFSDYVCMGRKSIRIQSDYFSTNLVKNATFSMPMKLNRHLRWDDSGTLINGQFFLLIKTKNGNASASTASTATIPYTQVNTGLTYGLVNTLYYVDN